MESRARCVIYQFGTFAFNTVRWWRKLGEVENECTSHILGSFPIFLPKIYQNWCNFDEVLTKTNLLSFFGTRCSGGFEIPVRGMMWGMGRNIQRRPGAELSFGEFREQASKTRDILKDSGSCMVLNWQIYT